MRKRSGFRLTAVVLPEARWITIRGSRSTTRLSTSTSICARSLCVKARRQGLVADVLPVKLRESLANAFYNLAMPRRFVNKVLQGRLPSAGDRTHALRAQHHHRRCRIVRPQPRTWVSIRVTPTAGQTFARLWREDRALPGIAAAAAAERARRGRFRRRLIHGSALMVHHADLAPISGAPPRRGLTSAPTT